MVTTDAYTYLQVYTYEALQFVQTLSFGEVLGLKASLGGLVYILFAETLVALQCSA